MTTVTRETRETQVRVEVLRNSGVSRIATTVPFLDHMLTTLSRYSGLTIHVEADGDMRHHIIEDVAITLGAALARFAPEAAARYGSALIPMDDALVQVAVDIGGRPYYAGDVPSSLYDHFMRSLSDNAKMTLHILTLRGEDRHHIVEAAFKALGVALGQALTDTGGGAVFSTKGDVRSRGDA